MKQTVEMEGIQRKMQPGVITRDGFLGSDERKLVDIIEADDAEVRRLGYTHEAIAHRMRELRDAAVDALGDFVPVGDDLEVSVETIRGKLPCPFGERGLSRKSCIRVRCKRTGQEIAYTDLNIHMIEKHGFYEGRGAVYRLEPADLVTILRVARPTSPRQVG